MEPTRLMVRCITGGITWGGLLGSLVGGFAGIIYGAFQGDMGIGLDGALGGGGLGLVAGAMVGCAAGYPDRKIGRCESALHETRRDHALIGPPR